MNEPIYQQQTQNIDLSKLEDEEIKKIRQDCDKELEKRHKEEVRKFKTEMKRKAEKFGLVVKVENKK